MLPSPDGDILTTCHTDRSPFGIARQWYTYEWRGGRCVRLPLHWIGEPDCAPGRKLVYGPYHLRVLSQNLCDGTVLAVRESGFPPWRVIVWRYRLFRWLDLIYRRFIITLAVWRLARYDPARVPSWRDIGRP